MKEIIFIFCLFLLLDTDISPAQSVQADSLEVRLLSAEQNEKIPILIELSEQLRQRDTAKALEYVAQAESLLTIYPDAEQESLLLTQKGWATYYLRDSDRALEYAQRADSLAASVSSITGRANAGLLRGRLYRDSGQFRAAISVLDSALTALPDSGEIQLRASIHNELGTVYRRTGDMNQALDHHNRALELVETTQNKDLLALTLNLLGIIHDITGNYDEALRYQMASYRVREELNDRRGMAASMTNIGILHQQIGQYQEALRFYEQSLSIWRELDAINPLASTLNNIGAVQELMGNYEAARSYYEQAHEIWSEQGNLYSVSISLNNLGTIHHYLGDYDKAMELKQQALANHLELGNMRGASDVLSSIAYLYQDIGQPDSALTAAERSLEFATETQSWELILNSHEILAAIYEEVGNFEKALEHQKMFKAASDTLFNTDSQSIISELQEQYRTRQQQQQIELLQRERENQKLWMAILIGGLSLALMIPGYMVYRHKINLRNSERIHQMELEKALLTAENAEARAKLLDVENRRKSKELEDARNLQLSMLPATLPTCSNASIAAYMKTAAEVGGDYYDVDLWSDGTLTFCIGDATGHGTKAGLLVMAVKSLFNLTSRERNLIKIMRRCSAAIKRMNLSQLYMTFAIARLKRDTLELVGGGMPPALLFRAATGEIESIDLKGMPLGSVPDYPYSLNTVSFYENDVLLLLSDGYPELLNKEGDMLGYQKPAEILAETGYLPIEKIIDRFRESAEEWTHHSNPNDDVTFLVVKRKAD